MVSIKSAQYPYGTLKIFPAWVIHYTSAQENQERAKKKREEEAELQKLRSQAKNRSSGMRNWLTSKCVLQ